MTKFIVASLAGLVAGLSAAPEAPAPRAADRVAVVVDASGPGAEARITAARADARERNAALRVPRDAARPAVGHLAARRRGLHHHRRLRPRGARRDRAARRRGALRRRRLTSRLAPPPSVRVQPRGGRPSEGGLRCSDVRQRSVRWRSCPARSRRRPPGRLRPPACPTRSCRSATRRSPVRPAAGPATRTPARRASTRSAPPPTTTRPGGEAIPGCHRSKAAEIHIGGIESKNLACSGARTYTQPYSSGSNFKPGPRLLRRRRRAHRPGQGAPAVRAHAQRAAGRRPHRRQQLRLRERRPDVRDELAHVADVVEELLPRRRERPQHVHRRLHRRAAHPGPGRARQRQAGDDERRVRAERLPARRADVLLPDPARRRLPLQGVRLHAPDDRRLRRLEPRRRLGQRHDGRDAQRPRRQARGRRGGRAGPRRPQRARRPPAVREHGRPAGGARRRRTGRRRAPPTRPSGSARSAR